MAITVHVSAGLRAWLNENLARGAPPAAMIEALIGRNIEPGVARGLVDAFLRADAAGQPLPEHSGPARPRDAALCARAPTHRARARDPRR